MGPPQPWQLKDFQMTVLASKGLRGLAEPADQRDEIEHPSTAEMTCIRDMPGAQFGAMEVRDELIE
jgi:hypothetical protein